MPPVLMARGASTRSPTQAASGKRQAASGKRQAASGKRLRELAAFLAESPKSPIRRFTPTGADIDIDSVIDVRAVFQQGHRELKVEELPAILLPRKGCFGLIDYEKAYSPDLRGGPDIFDLRGIDREQGVMIVVRPDQYVSNILPLDAFDELAAFFGQFLLDAYR